MSLSSFQQYITLLKNQIKPRILIFCSIYPNALLAASIFLSYCKIQKDWVYQVTFDDPVYFFSSISKVSVSGYDALLYIDLLPSSLYTAKISFFHNITTIKLFGNNYQEQLFPKRDSDITTPITTSNISIVSAISLAEFIATALNKLDPNFIISGTISELWIGLSYYYVNYNSKASETLAKQVKIKISSNTALEFDDGYFQFPLGLSSPLSSSLKSLNKPFWSDEKLINQFLASQKILDPDTEFNTLSLVDQHTLIEKIILRLNEEKYDPLLYLQPAWKLRNQSSTTNFHYGFEIMTFLTNFLRLGLPGKALEFLLSFPKYSYKELQDIHSNLVQKLMLYEHVFATKNITDRAILDTSTNSLSLTEIDSSASKNVFRVGWIFNNLFPAIIVCNAYISNSHLSFPIIRINMLHSSGIEKELLSLLNNYAKDFNVPWAMSIEHEFLLPYESKELLEVLKSLPFEGGFYR